MDGDQIPDPLSGKSFRPMRETFVGLSKFLQKCRNSNCLRSSSINKCEKKLSNLGFRKVYFTTNNGTTNIIFKRSSISALSQNISKKNYTDIKSRQILGSLRSNSLSSELDETHADASNKKLRVPKTQRYIAAPLQRTEFNHALDVCKSIVTSPKRPWLQEQSYFIPFIWHYWTSQSRPNDIISNMDQR